MMNKKTKFLPPLFIMISSIAVSPLQANGLPESSSLPSYSYQKPLISDGIKGTITDESGAPVIGAVVVSTKGNKHAVSDIEGKFSIEDATKGDVFKVTCLGYKEYSFKVGNTSEYQILMKEDNQLLDEVVVVGYGVQKKVTVTGSVASIGGNEIIKTKSTDVRNMLTGRIPGLRVVQNTAEPGALNTAINIRGFGGPLVIVDGVERGILNRLDPNEIESISVLKDAAAAVYGVKAANGVILITTKKGTNDGKVSIDYNGNMTWQMVSGLPSTVGVVDYMKMSNEKSMSKEDGSGTFTFDPELIRQYESGEKQGTDWYGSTIRNFVPQTQHNVSVSGGNKRINFFTNLGYQYQEGFFTYGSLNYNRFNLRTRVQAKITDNLDFDINLNHIQDNKFSPRKASNEIIRELWKQYPTDPVYADPDNKYYYFPTVDTGVNPIAWLDTDYSGYQENKGKWYQTTATLTYKVPFIKGLSLKALYSYDYNFSNNKTFSKKYELYRYDEVNDKYTSVVRDAPSSVRRNFSDGSKTQYQLSANFTRTFADSHNINAMVLFEGTRSKGDNFYAKRELLIDVDHLFAGSVENQEGGMDKNGIYEEAQIGIVGRLNYDYKSKYLAEFLCRYDGSSIFPKEKRFGFFPSFLVGYRISEEKFWKSSVLNFIDNFKLRASYGIMGDDGALAYQFLNGYEYPSGRAFFDGKLINGVVDLGIPNRNITWYTAHTMNIGFDAQAWKGLLGLTFDFFQRKRYGLLATRNATLPGTVGASLPQENLESDKNLGMEIEISHRNYVNKDFWYSVKANFSITRAMNMYKEQQEQRSMYNNWRNNLNNRYKSIYWGVEAGGQFTSWEEVAEFPIKTSRTTLPGDYWYKDWNGDGFIDDQDKHPIGFNTTPLLNYGLIFDLGYKGFDFNVLFQGAAMSNIAYTERLSNPMDGTSAPLDFFADRWRPADEGADPYKYDTKWIPGKYPSMGGTLVRADSEFNVHNSAYMRLKNIELGYTLPKKWSNKIRLSSLRFYVSGYNLLTFSGLKFVDPEHPNSNNGYMYPLNKTISLGVNLKL